MKKNKKIAIITGGSRGIGKATAKQLITDGYQVYICSKDKEEIKKVAQEISAKYFVLDLSDKKEIQKFVKLWDKPIDVLVNNAGVYLTEKIEEKDKGVWDEVISVNLNGLYWLTKGLVKYIQDNGRIVNISSQLGKEGRIGADAYCVSKFGVIALTKCWAKELGSRGIRVNAICPGWVKTEMLLHDFEKAAKEKGMIFEEFEKVVAKSLELGRMTEPEEVANFVSFLVSEKSKPISGRDYLINSISNRK